MKDPMGRTIFDVIDQCKTDLSKEEAQTLVEDIITLMRKRDITYECAYKVLADVKVTLEWLSRRLPL